MRKNAKKIMALELAVVLLFCATPFSVYAVSPVTSEVASETTIEEDTPLNDSIISEATTNDTVGALGLWEYILGEGKNVMSEGSYDYQYWKLELYGDGVLCWTRLNYGGTATTIETTLVVERGDKYWKHYDYYTLNNTNYNDSTCYCRWDDGTRFAALSATGSGAINGTTVDHLAVSGWW